MTKEIRIGKLIIGGGSRITVQSMTNTDTLNAAATKAQVEALAAAGCDIVRIAVSSADEISACAQLLKAAPVPLVADIQFDYRLAVLAADAGFNKIRFNPGNIGSEKKVAEVVAACKANRIPIRIGVNAGSLEKSVETRLGKTGEALAESALAHVHILEKHGFNDIVLSVKSSDVSVMLKANRILNQKTAYPLHLGVTESGLKTYGLVKSAIGIGALLADGIGDTVRVSLTGNPLEEIDAAKLILKAAGRLNTGCEIISCPTCSRCKVNLEQIACAVEAHVAAISAPLKIAVMGCVVNGPGEAKHADAGVAAGPSQSVLFKKGQVCKTVRNDQIIQELKKLIDEISQ
ncbi:MAG: flavodoxin-dependent (E)-4-hydroxy-3-methylbut-2-enyl-diphosphate synthase [Firmicutes bacterium]|nr:flavodoxin-dependent (E)-4-hydroxy-3-methylbut-2-enyl-diphosphate synthase [Bacillota bacterium]